MRPLTIHLALALSLLFIPACAYQRGESYDRTSDKPIIPGYVINPNGILVEKIAATADQYSISAVRGSFNNEGLPAAVRIAAYALTSDTAEKIRNSKQTEEAIGSRFLGELQSREDGSLLSAPLTLRASTGYLLLFVFDKAGGEAPVPNAISIPNPSAIVAAISEDGVGVFEGLFLHQTRSLWTSSEELMGLSESGKGYLYVRSAADAAFGEPILNPSTDTQVDSQVLAAAILYLKSGRESYRHKVIRSLDRLVSRGMPEDGATMTLVSSNLPGYVTAADLVGYRTPAFDNFLKSISTEWRGVLGNGTSKTMVETWRYAPSHLGGLQALLALATIEGYRGDKAALLKLATEWKQNTSGVTGDANKMVWVKNSWAQDPTKLRIINGLGAMKDCGNGVTVDISGFMPGFMGTEDVCTPASEANPTAFRGLELLVTVGRIFDRQGIEIFDHEDRAILRNMRALKARYGFPMTTLGRRAWILRYIDLKYGSRYSCGLEANQSDLLWGAGLGSSLGLAWVFGPLQSSCQ